MAPRVWVPPKSAPVQKLRPSASPSRARKSRYCCCAKRSEELRLAEKMSLSLAPWFMLNACSTQLGTPSPSLSRARLVQSGTCAVRKAAIGWRVQLMVRASSGITLMAGEGWLIKPLQAATDEPLPEQVSLGLEKRPIVGR